MAAKLKIEKRGDEIENFTEKPGIYAKLRLAM
jgi:hypothetical protein